MVLEKVLEAVILAVSLVVNPWKRKCLRASIKEKWKKKEAVKVQNKDRHRKAKKAKCKQSVHHDKGPKMKRRKESEQEEPSVKVCKTAVDDSGLKSALEKEAKSSSEGTIAILAEDYKSLLEFVR